MLACVAAACAPAPVVEPQNVLMIVIDDVGVDSLGVYPVNPKAHASIATPTIDSLAKSGIVFDDAWSNPTCSPTRATILTGRYAFRTSVWGMVEERSIHRLPIDEVTIPQVLAGLPDLKADSAAFGKWHLANCLNGREQHPNLAGFSYFAGQLYNLKAPYSYFHWPKTVNGTTAPSRTYSTTDNVDEVSAWIRRHGQRGPWFVYLAFNAPHWGPAGIWQGPATRPSARRREGTSPRRNGLRRALPAKDDRGDGSRDRAPLSEIERQRSHTTIILVADNGTPEAVKPDGSPYPARHLKSSLLEGGINVPLIISGPAVAHPGTRSSALVNTSDLFATVIELMSGQPIEKVRPGAVLDSKSLVPILDGTSQSVRDYAFASGLSNHYAIRNTRYKLIRVPDGEQLYDLSTDRHTEKDDLLHHGGLDSLAKANHEELSRALDDLTAPVRNACPNVAECTDCCAGAPSPPAECTFRPARTPDMQRCLLRDGTAFVCQQGTIHVRVCGCGGAGVDCVDDPPPGATPAAPRMSRTLVCR